MACLLSLLSACARDLRSVEDPGHGSGAARAALLDPGFSWLTRGTAGLHIHYLPGSSAAKRIEPLTAAAEGALEHDLRLMGSPRPGEPVEVFLVDTRDQARQLSGAPYMGQAIPGELTVFLVVLPETRPAFRHEIMHALTLARWGKHRTGTWMAEGVATWAAGSCQGHAVHAVAAGFLRDGTLPDLTTLATNFWGVDELRAYFTAGSIVTFIADTQGKSAVERLWKTDPRGTHPLGNGGAALESAWRAHLAEVPPVSLDPDRLRRTGC